jgi:glycosyltransferase involved in cell wall biosynthesis
MRIAQVAPLWERVPPPAYGGTELVVSLLTDELVRRGHEVTLFATADSMTLAKLDPGAPRALRLDGLTLPEYVVYEAMQLSKVFDRADEFDLIHSHMDWATLPYANLVKTPVVHTIHGLFQTPMIEKMYVQNRHQNFISISDSHRRTELDLNYVATVYNGIDPSSYEFHPEPSDPPYLAYFARMSREKGPLLAIEIAKRTGWKLKMAGKVDFHNEDFFKAEVEPLIDGDQIEYLGEATHDQKSDIMGGAYATLCPIIWKEPFGLVMPESMVCGTPVIAMTIGSAPELIVHGKTGFLCDTIEECVAALGRIPEIDRRACRTHVEENFGVKKMASNYEAVYRQVLSEKFVKNGHLRIPAPLM